MKGPARSAVAAACVALAAVLAAAPGCFGPAIEVIGRPGLGDGEFRDPRGLAVSEHGLAVVDRSGRLQVLELDGRFRSRFAVVPGDVRRGLPTGLAWLPDGNLAVAHSHESRIALFSPAGADLGGFGGYGVEPGRFLQPQRVALDLDGNFLVSEYGFDRTNRVQVLRPDGSPVRVLGGRDPSLGGLTRAMGALPLPDGRTLVADQSAGLLLFGRDGAFLGPFAREPAPEGSLSQGLCRDDEGRVYVADLGLHCVRRYAADGTPRGVFGGPGAEPGKFREPWDVAWGSGRLYVADTGNHRVQRIDPERVEWRQP